MRRYTSGWCVLWLALGLSGPAAWADPPGPPGGFTPPGGGGGTTQNASEVPLDDLCADNADWTGATCPANQQLADDQLASRVTALEGAGTPNASEIPLDGLCADDTDWTGSVCPADQQTADDQLAARVTVLESGGGGIIPPALEDLNDLGVVGAADKFIYSIGVGTWAFGDVTSAGRALLDDADAVAQLATIGLPLEYRVCSTCAYTTIQAAMNAAGAAGGGVVRVAPGTYSETVTAASGVSMVCDAGGVAGSAAKQCRINGTAGNPALVIDVGVPGGARENHVFSADGFLLSGGAGVGVGVVSFECPVAAAQRAELSNVSIVTGASGNALRVTCGAVGSGGLLSSLRLHGDYVQVWSEGSTEATVYHSSGYFDWRGRAVISAASGDDVAFEIPAAATGVATVWWFEIVGRVTVAATSTATLVLGQGIITTATSAPITTNGSGATTLGVVGLYAAGASPAGGCVQGAGLLAHTPSTLQNIANCGTLIAGTVNGGAGPDVAALQSRFESTVAPATYQPISAALQDLDDLGVVGAADKFIYSTGAGVWAYGDITTAGRALLDDASAGDQRTTLGLGALATGASAADVPFVCSVDANWTGGLCPGNSGASLDELASRVVTLEGAGGGSADAVTKSITQAGHGLSVGDWVRLSSGDYVEAQADSAANAEVVGVVSAVADVDNFTLTTDGYVTGLSGLTAGTAYFLSPSVAGALTSTDPTGTNVSKPLLVADSTTSGWVIILRGTISGSPTADWNWTQQVGAPTVTDWQDATAFGGDAALVTLADGTNGNYVLMVAGASLTDAYGAVTAAPAGDFTWCARFGVVTPNVPSQGTAITASAYAVYVDGTDLDTDPWYGDGLVAIIDDFAARLMYSAQSNGGGTNEWDATVSTVATNGYPNLSMDTCLVRAGTTLTTYFAPYQGTGWTKSASHTVGIGAGLFAIRITVGDAYQHRVILVAYGDPGGVPGLE